MKNFGCVTLLVMVLAVLLVLLVPWLTSQDVQAGYPTATSKPPPAPTAVPTIAPQPSGVPPEVIVPQSPPDPRDRGCRKGCKDEPRNKSNSTPTPLPKFKTVPQKEPKVYLPLVVLGKRVGSPNPYPYPAP